MIVGLSWALSAIVFVVVLVRIYDHGFLNGYRPVWLITLFVLPAWFIIPIGTLQIDPRSLAAVAVLLGLMFQRLDRRGPSLLFFSDVAVLLVVLSMWISNYLAQQFAPLAPLDRLRDWLLPYLMGRLFLEVAGDDEQILPVCCGIALALAAYAVFEGVVKVNPIDRALGKVWNDLGFAQLGERWGLKRANGPQSHPIYFGLSMAMLLPWCLRAAVVSMEGRGPHWWQLTPWALLAGIVCTGSRSAQLAAICVLVAHFVYRYPRIRAPFLLFGIVGAILLVVFRDEVISLLASYAEEREGAITVYINGLEYEYTGTKHRDLLYLVYQEGIDNNDWTGYGTQMLKLPRDPNMDPRFASIDNHYLMFFLQYGWLGIGAFVLLALAALANLIPTIYHGGPRAEFACGLLGAMIGVLIALRGVFFSMDFGWIFLFSIGVAAALERLRRLEALGTGSPSWGE